MFVQENRHDGFGDKSQMDGSVVSRDKMRWRVTATSIEKQRQRLCVQEILLIDVWPEKTSPAFRSLSTLRRGLISGRSEHVISSTLSTKDKRRLNREQTTNQRHESHEKAM